MLAIGRRRMHVIDRFELAAALAGVAENRACRRLSDDRLLDLVGADWRRPHTADRHRGARDLAAGITLEQDGGRRDGEVAVPARKLDEGIAVRSEERRVGKGESE